MSLIEYSGLDKPKRLKQPIAATEFQRVMERFPERQLPYPKISLSPSIIFDKSITELVVDYHTDEGRDVDWKLAIYSNHGDGAASVIQEYLFRANVLKCDATKFSEQTIYCSELGVKGRLDGILYPARLKYLGAVNEPLDFPNFPVPSDEEEVILEIKEVNDYAYSLVKAPEDIPEKFQWAQALYQKITNIRTTCFLYVNRDSLALKTMFWDSTPGLEKKVVDKVEKTWYHIRSKTVPGPDGDIPLEEYLKSIS